MIGSEAVELAKGAGVVLTALSGVAYACGYVVVRARAHALGTDPGFALLDQAYVFAGFRFVLVLLLMLLLMSPLLLMLHRIGRLIGLLSARPLSAVEAAAALSAGVFIVWVYAETISVSSVLLAPSPGWITDAVLERNRFGTVVVLGTTALSAAIALWTRAHFARASRVDSLGAVLLLMGVLLLIILPMQHGVFYADRAARLLDRVPDGVTGLASPVWLVDRGAADAVTLFGHSEDGRARLVTLKAERLEGIPVIGVSTLAVAVEQQSRNIDLPAGE